MGHCSTKESMVSNRHVTTGNFFSECAHKNTKMTTNQQKCEQFVPIFTEQIDRMSQLLDSMPPNVSWFLQKIWELCESNYPLDGDTRIMNNEEVKAYNSQLYAPISNLFFLMFVASPDMLDEDLIQKKDSLELSMNLSKLLMAICFEKSISVGENSFMHLFNPIINLSHHVLFEKIASVGIPLTV